MKKGLNGYLGTDTYRPCMRIHGTHEEMAMQEAIGNFDLSGLHIEYSARETHQVA